MKFSALSASEQRTIKWALLVLLPFAIYLLGVRPYGVALGEARDRLASERALLARERGAVAMARRNPELQHLTDSALRAMEPRLFEGTDDVIASSDLAAYVGELARAHHVWVQDAATRTASSATPGVRSLHVELRGESDLRGIIAFLDALEHGDKLVRIDRLDISRGLSGPGNEQAETLTLGATISGYALGNLNVLPSPALRVAPAASKVKP